MSVRLENVKMQLSELEILQSMYPDEDEIIIDDQLIYCDLKKFADEEGEDPVRTLKFILKLPLQDLQCALNIEFTPPLDYPSDAKVSAQIRSPDFTKTQYADINESLRKFIEELDAGEPQILQIIEWVNENGPNYITVTDEAQSTDKAIVAEGPQNFSRIWIYSHHIYNKVKRKNILEWAKELNLTGFSMPGKPGVVCVEGLSKDCEEFWLRMRRQTWKRLSLVHREDGLLQTGESGTFIRKFLDPVSEKDFGVHGGRDYHMDLGQFASFLADHQSHDIFSILFGVTGKVKIDE